MAEWHLQFRTLATTFGTEYRQTLGALSAGVGEFDEEHDDAPPCPYFFQESCLATAYPGEENQWSKYHVY